MSAPDVSIITVVRNDAVHLQQTIASVSQHKGSHTEFIVIDGASSDDTCDVIRSNARLIDRTISEPDRGIYDAMNKGITLARGRYLLFLNAGDELLTDIEMIVTAQPDSPVLIYGRANMVAPNGTVRYIQGKRLKHVRRFLKGMPLCHQAILYRRDAMLHYDLRFKVISDRVLTYRIVSNHGLANTRFIDCIFVNYYDGGFSGSYPFKLLREEEDLFFKSVGKSYYIIIKNINALFKYKIKLPFLKAIGQCVR
ncbi:MAG: glycosyltransferase family 2 protein [Desulfuromonadaceae bacterium]